MCSLVSLLMSATLTLATSKQILEDIHQSPQSHTHTHRSVPKAVPAGPPGGQSLPELSPSRESDEVIQVHPRVAPGTPDDPPAPSLAGVGPRPRPRPLPAPRAPHGEEGLRAVAVLLPAAVGVPGLADECRRLAVTTSTAPHRSPGLCLC